ncbi:demethylmenaquinone methyltransferase [Thermobispora bispora]|uniref:Demethylmenaquinone methyltransferase n=1 Tax=Thermobispora bispora (strain ATCC 19993 / DSM 43833 / CBS 139.67 / JCM 10125 / KCTC 9307 / NBRC 14880 / R51) TaxID=469371 RepID=D6Y3I0_THEBD|nr:demethylmenaquinone methyltransferase [Thermobispora bispora]ADG87009.1 ubiquinone/menaquinone biosynthesis methyltransferase [Thermobispora bispora DSM 43833]MBO2474441.1 demethylmenaquinone methyltransferase [Actinomycetales bacterium]MBX6166054.1 demethylmenaquinone methyltransferase [Thermobispora bispora]MDI9581475.1 demethylmenaquinone methyltransferase [Thermobispora sp.]
MTRASLDKQPREVAAMFDRTAKRYDLVNTVLSLGQDRTWRRATAAAIDAGPGELVLDLAAGTGTSTDAFTMYGARAIACDFSLGMLRTGVARRGGSGLYGGGVRGVTFIAGDALRLPFKSETFDAVTISFGLRNVADPAQALREMLRVTKPGGRLVICEFSRPPARWFDLVYSQYLMRLLPLVARLLSSNPDSYEYLAESIRAWPDQAALAKLIHEAGWEKVAWRNLTFGIVALHRAFKPGPGAARPGDAV